MPPQIHEATPQLLKGAPISEKGVPEVDLQPDEGSGGGKVMICRFCGNRITPSASAVPINGSHKHTFFNPHGYIFELGCFSIAPGVIRAGLPSPEFTWFAGHTWQVSLCGRCNVHIGWHYQSRTGTGFYGLILPQIAEMDDSVE